MGVQTFITSSTQDEVADREVRSRGWGSLLMVPGIGLEPIRYFYRGILNPLRLPISPPGQGQKNLVSFEERDSAQGLEQIQ